VNPTNRNGKDSDSFLARLKTGWRQMSDGQRRRLAVAIGALALVTLAMARPLSDLIAYTSRIDLHSHVVLIPFVAGYLLSLRWGALPTDYRTSAGWAVAPFLLAVGGVLVARGVGPWAAEWSVNDRLAAYAAAYVALVWAAGFLVLGAGWMKAATFPMAFLIFFVPLPDGLAHRLEIASQLASAEVSSWLFQLTGLPHLRDGNFFQLPGITLEVAEECSGIRSSWVLFITSLVAADMFLHSRWRRFILVALVIPLGLLRNGFRILVISWLCVEVGPQMIDSFIHHRGGPIFFALSLIPLFLILWILRRGDPRPPEGGGPPSE